MSTHIAPDTAVNAIAQLAEFSRWHADPELERQRIATMIRDVNNLAYGRRYGGEVVDPQPITYAPSARVDALTPVEVLKLCDYVEYQLDEAADADRAQATQVIDGIRRAWIRRLAGYDSAPWGLD